MSKEYKVAVVAGDGIGPEIVPQAIKVLDVVGAKHGFAIKYTSFPYGAAYYKKHGRFMPADGLTQLRAFDAILFGAVGLPDVDDTLPAMEYTFKVRTGFQQYVNYRPIRSFPGVKSPLAKAPKLDMVVIRENTEGEFVQAGSFHDPDGPNGLATETSVFTRSGVTRVARYAFALARRRRKKVTNVTKSNTLIHSLAYWDRVISEVAAEFPDVACEKMYVDNASANFVLHPERFDVVLTTNMIGDILSDLGGALMGSLGLGGSGNINPEHQYPSMFEPIHGSAPDIAGKGIANPLGTIWAAAIMLEHLGQPQAAVEIMAAMDAVTGSGLLPADLDGQAGTKEIGDAVAKRLRE